MNYYPDRRLLATSFEASNFISSSRVHSARVLRKKKSRPADCAIPFSETSSQSRRENRANGDSIMIPITRPDGSVIQMNPATFAQFYYDDHRAPQSGTRIDLNSGLQITPESAEDLAA
jgi:hypothetical protein